MILGDKALISEVVLPQKSPSLKDVPNLTGVESAPTTLTRAASSHNVVGTSPRLEPAEFPKAPPPSPHFDGLGATGGP
jgi:hypothetical protein